MINSIYSRQLTIYKITSKKKIHHRIILIILRLNIYQINNKNKSILQFKFQLSVKSYSQIHNQLQKIALVKTHVKN
jgi:hypothetical protein